MKKLNNLEDSRTKKAEPKTEEKAGAAEPKYVTTDELAQWRNEQTERNKQNDEIIASLRQNNELLMGQLESLKTPTYRPPAEPEIAEPTDEELQTALTEGDTRKVKQLLAARDAKLRKELKSEIDQIRGTGLTAIAGLAKERLASLPHYKRFEKEITAKLASLPPESQINSQVLDIVYRSTIGEHYDELAKEEREAALRGERAEETPDVSTRNAGSGDDADAEVPTAAEYTGNGAIYEFLNRGGFRDEDEFARRIRNPKTGRNYKDWDEFIRTNRRNREELH